MPTISRFFGITITMYFEDHSPPHFHAIDAEGEAKIEIDPLVVVSSGLSRRGLGLVIEWANQHQGELMDNWNWAREHETLKSIEPLR